MNFTAIIINRYKVDTIILGGIFFFILKKYPWLILTILSKFLSYNLFDCKDIYSFSNKPSFQIQTYPQSLKDTREEENHLTLTERNRRSLKHFSFKLHVHFDKWIGSDFMSTALMLNSSYSTERTRKLKFKIVAALAFLAIFKRSLLRPQRPRGSYSSFFLGS